MRMRVRFSHPDEIGVDAWGGEIIDSDNAGTTIEAHCYAWHPTDVRQVLDGDKDGVFGAVRLIVPASCSIDETCIVEEVVDRVDRVLFQGPMRVTAATRRSGYIAVMLRTARSNRAGV
jgi:hypothetical protein